MKTESVEPFVYLKEALECPTEINITQYPTPVQYGVDRKSTAEGRVTHTETDDECCRYPSVAKFSRFLSRIKAKHFHQYVCRLRDTTKIENVFASDNTHRGIVAQISEKSP